MDVATKSGVDASVSSVVNSDEFSTSSTRSCKTNKQQVTLTDLCPADKEKVANLIRELAKLGAEKEKAIVELTQHKDVLEKRDVELANHRAKMNAERDGVQSQLQQCQDMIDKYQTFLSAQQDKWAHLNTAGRSLRPTVDAIPSSLSAPPEPLEPLNAAATRHEKLCLGVIDLQKPRSDNTDYKKQSFQSIRSEDMESLSVPVQQSRFNSSDSGTLSANPLNRLYIQPMPEQSSRSRSFNTFSSSLSDTVEAQTNISDSSPSSRVLSFPSVVSVSSKNTNLSDKCLPIDRQSLNTDNYNGSDSNYYCHAQLSWIKRNDSGLANSIPQPARGLSINRSQKPINLREQPETLDDRKRFSLHDDVDEIRTLLLSSNSTDRGAQNSDSIIPEVMMNSNAPILCVNDIQRREIDVTALNKHSTVNRDDIINVSDEAQRSRAASQTSGVSSQLDGGLFTTNNTGDTRLKFVPNEYNGVNKFRFLNPESKLEKIVNAQKCRLGTDSRANVALSSAEFFASRPRIIEQQRYDDEVNRVTIRMPEHQQAPDKIANQSYEYENSNSVDSLSDRMRFVRLESQDRHGSQISVNRQTQLKNHQFEANSFMSDDSGRVPTQLTAAARNSNHSSQHMHNGKRNGAQNYSKYTPNTPQIPLQVRNTVWSRTQVDPVHPIGLYSNRMPKYSQMNSVDNSEERLHFRDSTSELTQIPLNIDNDVPKSAQIPRQMSNVGNSHYSTNAIHGHTKNGSFPIKVDINKDARNISASSQSGLPAHKYSNYLEYQSNCRQINDELSSSPGFQTSEQRPLHISDRQRTYNLYDSRCTNNSNNYPDCSSIDLINQNSNIDRKLVVPHHHALLRCGPNDSVVEYNSEESASNSMLNKTFVGNIPALDSLVDDAQFVDRSLSKNLITNSTKMLDNSNQQNSVDLSVDLLDFILDVDNDESACFNSRDYFNESSINGTLPSGGQKSNLKKSGVDQNTSNKREVTIIKPSQESRIRTTRGCNVNVSTGRSHGLIDAARHKESQLVSSDHSRSEQVLKTDIINRVDTDLEESRLLDDIFFIK